MKIPGIWDEGADIGTQHVNDMIFLHIMSAKDTESNLRSISNNASSKELPIVVIYILRKSIYASHLMKTT